MNDNLKKYRDYTAYFIAKSTIRKHVKRGHISTEQATEYLIEYCNRESIAIQEDVISWED